MEGYLYFYFIKTIFAFLNRHEACLSILVTISCNFQICKRILYDQNYYTTFIIKLVFNPGNARDCFT